MSHEKFEVGELALHLPPLRCRCADCMRGVGEIVTIIAPLHERWDINGGWAYGIRFLNGEAMVARPEVLQKLPPVEHEPAIAEMETSHV